MIRKIIVIDEEKCDGCGLCAKACHEGAIGMVDGKAQLLRDDYCDGLGDCLPACPMDAISFEEREALPYDEAAVKKAKEDKATHAVVPGRLEQWPVQIKLVSPRASYFDGANLLVAADCTAFAYGNFHNDFIRLGIFQNDNRQLNFGRRRALRFFVHYRKAKGIRRIKAHPFRSRNSS